MEKELEDFIASQMHNIKVRYHIVGKQEELQEIYDLYQKSFQGFGNLFRYRRSRKRNICD